MVGGGLALAKLDPRVKEVAEHLWRLAYRIVDAELHDPASTGQIVEKVASEVSSRLRDRRCFEGNLTGYFMTALRRSVRHQSMREQRVAYEGLTSELELKLADLTADDIEGFLRRRLKPRVQVKAKEGCMEKGLLKATTVHQELRVLRRMLNVAVRRKFLFANPCSGVEFPAKVDGLFRPHYVTWSEQQKIEVAGPEYLRNVIRIVTETGLRIHKELTPMKKEQLDLENGTVWIPDSKTPNGIAEVPLTEIAVDAFRKQLALSLNRRGAAGLRPGRTSAQSPIGAACVALVVSVMLRRVVVPSMCRSYSDE